MAVTSLVAMTQKIEATLLARGYRNSVTIFNEEIVPDQVEHLNSIVLPANMVGRPGADFIDWEIDYEILVAFFVSQMDERGLVSGTILPAAQILIADLVAYEEIMPRNLSASVRSAEGGQVVVLTLRAAMNFCQNL